MHQYKRLIFHFQAATDVNLWLPQGESSIMATGMLLPPSPRAPFLTTPGVLNCIRVYGGYNVSNDPATLFDADGFVEKNFVDRIHETSGNVALAMNWYVQTVSHDRIIVEAG